MYKKKCKWKYEKKTEQIRINIDEKRLLTYSNKYLYMYIFKLTYLKKKFTL